MTKHGTQEHNEIPAHQHDGNISLNIEGMVARVYVRQYSHPRGEYQEMLFESGDWEEAQEKYVEATMLRDISGFKDPATIRKNLGSI
jgi:hypothetical protein